MARNFDTRLKITGELIAETPLHVGGYGESFETDMALARNGKDEFYVPGTSVTGCLREWFKKNYPDEFKEVWGYQEGDSGHASFILVEDLTLPSELQPKIRPELRDGVGIDRVYGTAADKAKFDRAILPKGTRLKLEITADIQGDANSMRKQLETMLTALQKGQVRLGGGKTRGLGKVTCAHVTVEEYSFNSFNGILDAVVKKPIKRDLITKFKREASANLLDVKITWKPKSPVMVKAGYDGIGVDMLPLTSGVGGDHVSLVLPGSSIKGAFRAQAERIVRTLFDIEAPCDANDRQNFSNQVRMFDRSGKPPAGSKLDEVSELIGLLFGAKKERPKENGDQLANKRKERLGLGALSIDDCYFRKHIELEDWQTVETGGVTKIVDGREEDVSYTDQELWRALKRVEGDDNLVSSTTEFAISHHVAIDRWTGGAADGALYSVLQPTTKIGWEDIRLTLDLQRLSDPADKTAESLQKRSLMLLLLVLRDFAENRLPLGFATNRGMGDVEDVTIEISGKHSIQWDGGRFIFTDSNLKDELEEEWKRWIDKE